MPTKKKASKWVSRKLAVAVLTALLVTLNKVIGLDLSEDSILALSGVAVAYLIAQGYVDSKESKE